MCAIDPNASRQNTVEQSDIPPQSSFINLPHHPRGFEQIHEDEKGSVRTKTDEHSPI